ncbi:MFS general substrate transporter [Xylariaceae sp. FL1272]|nr:MFS general substrate transporter [Xylariaceae sp. FL1272]
MSAQTEQPIPPADSPTTPPQEGDKPKEEAFNYPSGLNLILVTFALMLNIFLILLDGSIVSTAVPKITNEFSSLDHVGWYASVYFMGLAVSQLLFGKLNAIVPNTKWTYLACMILFLVGSAVCGAAPSSPALIVGRAIAGFAAGGVLVGTFSLIPYTVPPVRRPLFTGLIGAVLGIGNAVGPLIGGAITMNVTWRWCFYINLPIGGFASIVFFFVVHPPTKPVKKLHGVGGYLKNLDLIGLFFLTPSIVTLLLATMWGGTTYPWNDGRIIALLVLFGSLFIVFADVQYWQNDRAMLPRRVITQRSVVCSSLFAFGSSGASFLLVYYVPIWFQTIQGASPFESGVRNLPMVVATTIFSLLGGVLISVTGYYSPFMILSSILSAVGSGLLTTFHPNTPSSQWIGYQVIYGLGVGLSRQTPLVAVQSVLALQDVPIGSGVIMFCQTVAGAVFNAVAQTVLINGLSNGIRQLNLPDLDPAALLASGATGLGASLSPEQYTEFIRIYSRSLTTSWYTAVTLTTLSIIGALLVEHKLIRGKQEGKKAADAENESASIGKEKRPTENQKEETDAEKL